MKTSKNLRTSFLKATLSATIISISLMSCSKENLEPTSMSSDQHSSIRQAQNSINAAASQKSKTSSIINIAMNEKFKSQSDLVVALITHNANGETAYSLELYKDGSVVFTGSKSTPVPSANFRIAQTEVNTICDLLNRSTFDDYTNDFTPVQHPGTASANDANDFTPVHHMGTASSNDANDFTPIHNQGSVSATTAIAYRMGATATCEIKFIKAFYNYSSTSKSVAAKRMIAEILNLDNLTGQTAAKNIQK